MPRHGNLEACGLKAHSTVTLACAPLYGGSLVIQADKHTGQKSVSNMQSSKVGVEEAEEMSQRLLQTVSDINVLDDNTSILDPLHYAKQMLANPLGVAEEYLSFDKVL